MTKSSTVITRFAPSPTGYLHIGSARTALFNWLFAKHHQGQFLLRIEDTDQQRSTQEAVQTIFDSMEWLGLDYDGDAIFQFARAHRHAEVAHQLLKEGKAYYCYCTAEELEAMRSEAKENHGSYKYNGMWRDRNPNEAPVGVKPSIRFKAPQTGETIIHDLVQGDVKINNSQLDDMVILRSDGTPTYMLSVVVDDHDMNITHVIRGDDHLTNAFRQKNLYLACGWDVPAFAHIPLIHGSDGAKLSKRHGAVAADSYKDMGILPEAMRNYLVRLGWSHGDDEIIPTEKAIEWFDVDHIGKSPARFDDQKLLHLNGHYIKEYANETLVDLIIPLLKSNYDIDMDQSLKTILIHGMEGIKQRSKTIIEIADQIIFYCKRPTICKKDQSTEAIAIIDQIDNELKEIHDFKEAIIDAKFREIAKKIDQKLGAIAAPIRLMLTGSSVSPSIFQIMEILGKEETLARLKGL
jgi:glutamyl-tRNA synthetase